MFSGNFNPHWFDYPGSTFVYPLFAVYFFIFLVQFYLQIIPDIGTFLLHNQHDPSLLYILGRTSSLLYGIGSIIILYCIAKKFTSPHVALLASFFLAISPGHVERSKVIRVDSPLVFFLLLTLYCSLLLYEKKKLPYYTYAGIALGLAISSKYPGLVGIFPIMTAYIATLSKKEKSRGLLSLLCNKKIITTVLSTVVTFLLTTPFLIFDIEKAIYDINYEARTHQLGQDRLPGIANHFWYLTQALPEAMGGLLTLMSLIGIIYWSIKKPTNKPFLIVLSYTISYWIFTGMLSLRWVHWILPIVPILCIFSASFLQIILTKLKFKNKVIQISLALFFILFISSNPLYNSIVDGFHKTAPDTRSLAFEWCLNHIPAGSKIGREMSAPSLPEELFHITSENFLAIKPLSFYLTNQYDYLITSSYLYDRFAAEKELYPQFNDFYQDLFTHYKQVAIFKPNLLPNNIVNLIIQPPQFSKIVAGEEIRIYQLSKGDTSYVPNT